MKEILVLKESNKKIKDAKDIFKNIKKINIDFGQENFLVFYLSSANELIDSEVLFKGGLSECLVSQQTLFRKALLNNSAKIIISHNHPSGNLKPSNEDISIYNRLKEVGDLIGISIIDNIIFNEDEFYSFSSEGLS